jgi:hypothetical protein
MRQCDCLGDSNGLNQRKAGRYDAAGIPKYSASAYVDYQHQSGFGVNLSGWWTVTGIPI